MKTMEKTRKNALLLKLCQVRVGKEAIVGEYITLRFTSSKNSSPIINYDDLA